MNLAITVLVAIAIAAVIGTVLQQNQAYNAYISKFGPFWFEVFKSLDLYDIYGAWWFLALLGFLVLSTSVCIYRNAPVMLRDMRHFRLGVKRASLRAFHVKHSWTTQLPAGDLRDFCAAYFRARGYTTRVRDEDTHSVVAAMKGAGNRLGYLFTHVAMVVICLGALFDGTFPLRLAELSGNLKVETRNLPASEVPPESVLGVENRSFRGSVNIAEGQRANLVFLNMRDGYVVQKLPFEVELKDFRVEHYPSGQPKAFASDLVIHDPELAEPLTRTIKVNHPLTHKGYTIYQASFSDGGSKLQLALWPLNSPELKPLNVEGAVQGIVPVRSDDEILKIELDDFRLFNINPVNEAEQAATGKKFRNFGPSLTFKVRDATGSAREYINYMSPVMFEERPFLMSGVRESVAEPFQYLHIPADPQAGPERFLRFRAAIQNLDGIKKVAHDAARQVLASLPAGQAPDIESLTETIRRLLELFARDGLEGITAHVRDNVPEASQEVALGAYVRMLRNALGHVYLDLLKAEGVDVAQGIGDVDSRFFDDAVNTLSILGGYHSPFYAQLKDFTHIQASGLQIARAPGKNTVYFGCVLLILGVFMMFYISHRRCWIWIESGPAGRQVLFAGSGNRHQRDFADEFAAMRDELDGYFKVAEQNSPPVGSTPGDPASPDTNGRPGQPSTPA